MLQVEQPTLVVEAEGGQSLHTRRLGLGTNHVHVHRQKQSDLDNKRQRHEAN